MAHYSFTAHDQGAPSLAPATPPGPTPKLAEGAPKMNAQARSNVELESGPFFGVAVLKSRAGRRTTRAGRADAADRTPLCGRNGGEGRSALRSCARE